MTAAANLLLHHLLLRHFCYCMNAASFLINPACMVWCQVVEFVCNDPSARAAILRTVGPEHYGMRGRDGLGSGDVGGSLAPLPIFTTTAPSPAASLLLSPPVALSQSAAAASVAPAPASTSQALSFRAVLRSVYGGAAGSRQQKLRIVQQLARKLVPAPDGTLDFLYD